jgi:hypothetical protein
MACPDSNNYNNKNTYYLDLSLASEFFVMAGHSRPEDGVASARHSRPKDGVASARLGHLRLSCATEAKT